MLKVIVVDDHPFIRSSVKMLLAHEGFEVVAETDNGVDAVQLIIEHKPDIVVLDITIPKLDGLEVIRRIRALQVSTRIMVLTSLSARFYSMRCMSAGAAGYISKTDGLDELARGVKVIMSGYSYFPDLQAISVRRSDGSATDDELIDSLSNRELAILKQLANGLSNKEIGDIMLLSNKTVSTYKARLIEKLNVTSVVYLADFAKRNDLL
ncbi:response regulator transcription factor [Pseudomonas sp. Irchel s3h17]|uniref:response regulator transcription factor n=1 Tax=Pseudomonas sp. Irchel s3h17 TaxID=2009182 RepID=UPI000BA40094|nr:response regulator transcription factor [Pseudomonas sp. Irchel s3h17]